MYDDDTNDLNDDIDADDDESDDNELDEIRAETETKPTTPTPTTQMIEDILKGPPARKRTDGCKEPIALVKSSGETWEFTDSNADIVNSQEVVFGSSAEEMISKLEIYLGIADPRLVFLQNHSWSNHHTYVSILNHPRFRIEGVWDIGTLISLIDEYGDIEVSCGSSDYNAIRQELSFKGYYLSSYNGIVKKDPKQAKAFLRRLKNKKKKVEATFWVAHLYDSAHHIRQYLPGFHMFRSRTVCREAFVNIIGMLFMIEGIYGKGSRYRIEPFRKLIKKWRSTPKKSHAFNNMFVADFVQWMDREAALPDNKKPLITKMEFLDVLNGMASKKAK